MWLARFSEFADESLQRRSWLGDPPNESPHWSYVEWMCCYFDDCSLSEGYETFVDQGFVSPAEAKAVLDFHQAASDYNAPNDDDYDHVAILDDPAWHRVIALAQVARERLLALVEKPDERRMLLPREPY